MTDQFEDTGHSDQARKQLLKLVIGEIEGGATVESKKTGSDINPAVLVAILVAIVATLYLLLNP